MGTFSDFTKHTYYEIYIHTHLEYYFIKISRNCLKKCLSVIHHSLIAILLLSFMDHNLFYLGHVLIFAWIPLPPNYMQCCTLCEGRAKVTKIFKFLE